MKSSKTKHAYLAGHQRSWVWGRHAVTEILAAGKWPMLELYLAEDMPEDARAWARQHAGGLGAACETATRERLRQLCGVSEHQGYLARMGPFPYTPLDEVLTSDAARTSMSLFLALDSIRDPQNFGAIIRSAAALGAAAVLVGEENQAIVNNHVARASAGAVNRIPIVKMERIEEVLLLLKKQGYVCVATRARAERFVWECDFTKPAVIVIGNEGVGIRPEIEALCDMHLAIPLNNDVDSLNAAMTAAAVLYEARRQHQ